MVWRKTIKEAHIGDHFTTEHQITAFFRDSSREREGKKETDIQTDRDRKREREGGRDGKKLPGLFFTG